MDFTITTIVLSFGAGFASILSPCVLPVVPIIVTGSDKDSKYRPLSIVAGLSITFTLMGIISSLAGSLIAGKLGIMEKGAGVLIILFGVLMLLNINLFKYITFFNRFQRSGLKNKGVLGGLLMGLILGLVWIPCVGPMLSSVLATVATAGKIGSGVFLLTIYSLGFALPMLIAGYATQIFRKKVSVIRKAPVIVRILNGGILISFGIYILTKGLINFGY